MTSRGKAFIAIAAAASAVLALAVPASAAPTYQTSFGSFDPAEPQALTVDQDNGDVYAIDNTNGFVRRFDSSGNPKPFTAGPDSGTNTLGASTPFGFFSHQVAVDNSGDPDTDGNIYVIDFGPNFTGQVHAYSNDGAPLGVIDGTQTPNAAFTGACGVAVDQSNGDLYVGDLGDFANGNVFRYSPSSATPAETDYSGAIATEAGTICHVAVAQGTVFAGSTNPFFGDGSVRAYPTSAFATGPPPTPTGTLITASGATSLAADPDTGNVYVDRGNQISVFDSSGASVYDFGSAAEFSGSAGVGVNGQSGVAYVGDQAGAQIDVYASPQPPTYQTSFGSFDPAEPQALTVDQDNGDVYAIDNTNGFVRRFDSSGNPKPFTAGPDSGTNTLGASTPFGFFSHQVAVDNSGDPDTDGNIYVIDFGPNFTGQVHAYSNDGAPLGVIDGTQTPNAAFTGACGVAVDQSNGDLYVGDLGDFANGNVFRYSPSSATPAETDYSGAIATEAGTICHVAVAQGTVFAGSTNPFFGDGSVRAYPTSAFATGPPPTPTGTLITASGATSLAADPDTGNVYVDRGNQISVFDSSGASVYDFGSAAEFSGSAGVGVNGQSGVAYVGDQAGAQIDVYASAPPAFAPGVVTQPATAIGPDTATLHATVNPRSGDVTDCHFDYLTEADFEANPPGDRFAGADTAPCDVDPGAGADPVAVSAELTGLPSGNAFRYRISATNSEGTSLGDPASFATTTIAFTDPATGTNHFTNATLNGHIDTAGDAITDCWFDYGPDANYGQTADCDDVTLPITSDQDVSAFVNQLPPDDAVHFRLHLVTATYGDALGPDRLFLPASTLNHELVDIVGSPGSGAGQLSNGPGIFDSASDVAVDQSSGDVWVADAGNHRVVRFDSAGDFELAVGRDVVLAGPGDLPGVNEIQELNLQNATAGTFTLALEGNTTSAIPFDTSASTVLEALEGLPNLDPGDVQISGGGPFVIEFTGTRAGTSVALLDFGGGNLVSTFPFPKLTTIQEGGASEVCRAADGDACRAGAPGDAPGQFDRPGSLAVDNSPGSSQGDIYVAPSSNVTGSVTKLDSDGSIVTAWGSDGQLTQAALNFAGAYGIAVDSAGRLNLIVQPGNAHAIQRRDGVTGGLLDATWGLSLGGEFAIESGGTYLLCCAFGAVRRFDPSGPGSSTTPISGAAVDDGANNNLLVTKASAAGGANVPEGVDVALDPASGDAYVAGRGNLAELRRYRFDAAGNVAQPDGSICHPASRTFSMNANVDPGGCDPFEVFGRGDLTSPRGLDLNGDSQRVYVTDSGQLKLFDGFSLIRPTLTLADPVALGADSATLAAQVDPEGEQLADCRFSYLTDSAYLANPADDRFAGAAEVPCNPDAASLGDGSGDVPVSAGVSGLEVATKYRYRIEAAHSDPRSEVVTADRAFTTRGPIATRTRAHPVTDTDAVLRATVNPQGTLTSYRFEYGTDTSYGSSTPESTAIGGNADRNITQFIAGLTPGTTYHFRLVAANADATVHGPDASFTTAAESDSCPNAALRTGHGFHLPDCRAYEQASIANKQGAHAITTTGVSRAASDGAGVTYAISAGLPIPGGQQLSTTVARRLAGGWASVSLSPLTASGAGVTAGQSPDLSLAAAVGDGAFQLGDTATGLWSTAFPVAGLTQVPAFSADNERFLIASTDPLTGDAVAGDRGLFLYDHGSLSLASRVPAPPATQCADGGLPADDCVVPSDGAFAGSYNNTAGVLTSNGGDLPAAHPVSATGDRIVFTESGTGRLYLRKNGDTTVQLNASQATAPETPKPAAWSASSADGDLIYFTSCERLTDDSTAVSSPDSNCTIECPTVACNGPTEGSDLYRYHVPSGQLTDLTVDPSPGPRGADVQRVLGASDDGSWVYFAANGDLDGPGSASAGNCVPRSRAGACQLYLSHDGGAPQAIAMLSGDDIHSVQDGSASRAEVRVAADGTLLIDTLSPLTAYDNVGPTCASDGVGAAPCRVLYRYRPGDPSLACVSCPAGAAPPVGHVEMESGDFINLVTGLVTPQPTRVISADGDRVFFQTAQALLPADVNGDAGCPTRFGVRLCSDVYQWTAVGADGCDSADSTFAPESGGCLYLLSSGTSDDPSWFVDASASGDDVFIRTTDRLVPSDADDLHDVYDARVGGGFASQHPVSVPPCLGDDCQGDPAPPPADPGPGTAQPGAGNQPKDATPPITCKKNQKLKNGRCVKKKKRKKKGRRK